MTTKTDHDEQIIRDVRSWLAPLLAGGLSAARTAEIGPTAERLAETILIGLENTLAGKPRRLRFDEPWGRLPHEDYLDSDEYRRECEQIVAAGEMPF